GSAGAGRGVGPAGGQRPHATIPPCDGVRRRPRRGRPFRRRHRHHSLRRYLGMEWDRLDSAVRERPIGASWTRDGLRRGPPRDRALWGRGRLWRWERRDLGMEWKRLDPMGGQRSFGAVQPRDGVRRWARRDGALRGFQWWRRNLGV